MKAKVIFKETYGKGAYIDKFAVMATVKNSCEIYVKDKGKMSDGKEFITVTIFV